jgi:hypothetical protein
MTPAHIFSILNGIFVRPLSVSFVLIINEVVFEIVVFFDDYVVTTHHAWMGRGNIAKLPIAITILVDRQAAAIAHAIFQLPRAEGAAIDSIFKVMDGHQSAPSRLEETSP